MTYFDLTHNPGIQLSHRTVTLAMRREGLTLYRMVLDDGRVGYLVPDYDTGYYVASESVGQIIGFENLRDIDNFVCPTKIVREPTRFFLGIWWDEDAGYWDIDVVEHTYDLTYALGIAKTYNQKAIYDIAREGIINV